jgi:hypothetical protein
MESFVFDEIYLTNNYNLQSAKTKIFRNRMMVTYPHFCKESDNIHSTSNSIFERYKLVETDSI